MFKRPHVCIPKSKVLLWLYITILQQEHLTVIVIRLFITRLALYGREAICHSLINQITDGFDQTLRYLNSATQTELQSHSSAYWNFLYVFFLQKMLNAENILQQHQSENELSTSLRFSTRPMCLTSGMFCFNQETHLVFKWGGRGHWRLLKSNLILWDSHSLRSWRSVCLNDAHDS